MLLFSLIRNHHSFPAAPLHRSCYWCIYCSHQYLYSFSSFAGKLWRMDSEFIGQGEKNDQLQFSITKVTRNLHEVFFFMVHVTYMYYIFCCGLLQYPVSLSPVVICSLFHFPILLSCFLSLFLSRFTLSHLFWNESLKDSIRLRLWGKRLGGMLLPSSEYWENGACRFPGLYEVQLDMWMYEFCMSIYYYNLRLSLVAVIVWMFVRICRNDCILILSGC